MHAPWTFAYVADMQPGSPKSYRFLPAWMENWQTARKQVMEAQPEFLLIGGDVSRDGSIHQWELENMKADFDGMGVEYHVIPGNMDTGNKHTTRQGAMDSRDDISLNITSAHLRNWKAVFGDWKWSFTRNNLRVSGFCDMIINSGLPEEQELWSWLEQQTQLPPVDHHIWLMHYALFIDHPDEPNWDIADPDQYLQWYFSIDLPGRRRLLDIFEATNITRLITGHVHCQHDAEYEGIYLDYAPAVCGTQFTDYWPEGEGKQGFYLYHVIGSEMTREYVPLEHISTRTDGYGPAGHPKPDQRDYSLAWEK